VVREVDVIEDPSAAAVALDPVRARLLAVLGAAPASAARVAARLGLVRQKVNYHLRTLEAHGLVTGDLSFYAFADDDRSGVHLQGFLFSDRAPAYVEREQPRWQTWLDGVAADVASSTNFSR
jgi:DNA-binding transcriptional ArsR family regulator